MAQKLKLRAWQHAYPDSRARSQRRTEPVLHLCMMPSVNTTAQLLWDLTLFIPQRGNEWLNEILWFTEVGSWQVGSWNKKKEGWRVRAALATPRSFKMPTAPSPPHTHTHTHTRGNFPTRSQSEPLLTSREEVVVSEPRAPWGTYRDSHQHLFSMHPLPGPPN